MRVCAVPVFSLHARARVCLTWASSTHRERRGGERTSNASMRSRIATALTPPRPRLCSLTARKHDHGTRRSLRLSMAHEAESCGMDDPMSAWPPNRGCVQSDGDGGAACSARSPCSRQRLRPVAIASAIRDPCRSSPPPDHCSLPASAAEPQIHTTATANGKGERELTQQQGARSGSGWSGQTTHSTESSAGAQRGTASRRCRDERSLSRCALCAHCSRPVALSST